MENNNGETLWYCGNLYREKKMKVLWICNVPIPEAKEVMGDETQVRVSWLVGISEALRKKVDLYIAYTSFERTEIATGKGSQVTFIAVPRSKKAVNQFDEQHGRTNE